VIELQFQQIFSADHVKLGPPALLAAPLTPLINPLEELKIVG